MGTLIRLTAALGLLLIGSAAMSHPLQAADFRVNVEFHINTQRHSFDYIVDWLKANIRAAESLYSNDPALVIVPTFVQENHPRIEVRTDSAGRRFSYLGFDNASDLSKFMENNFDNQARTKTEGHLTVLVVDDVVKNEDKDKGLCGRSTFPHWVNPFSRKLGILLAACDDDKYLFAHEIGHFFSLKHTFEPYVNLNPFSVSNCNKDFGNHIKCNSCQGRPAPDAEGNLRFCDGTSNVMDYCGSTTGREVLNACQLNRAARQRERYQTSDGKTDYQAMAGARGEGACEADSDCEGDEFCTTGILNLARNVCKPKLDRGAACTSQRQCGSDRCSWGVCADADECQSASDCGSGNYCGDPISGKRTCKSLQAHGQTCTRAEQCATGRCSWGFCADADECRADSDCGPRQHCGDPIAGKRMCKDLLTHGQICTKGEQCASGKCPFLRCQ